MIALLLFLLAGSVQDPLPESADDPARLPDEAVLFRVDGASAGDWFGYAVAGLGDVNGDGVPDFAVGAHQNMNWGARPAPDANPGYVRVYSGKDGALLYTLTSSGGAKVDGADDHFGFAITAVDDLDGDGAREVFVGSYLYDAVDGDPETNDENTGGAFLFSGASGELMRLMPGVGHGDRLGWAVATLSDRDGDGKRDLLVGVEKADVGEDNAGSVHVVSSASFELLLRVEGTGDEELMGSACVEVGDMNGDGVSDFAGGAFNYSGPGPQPEGPRERGRAVVYSGADGAVLHDWKGAAEVDHFGYALAGLGDVDGDGVPDLALGATQSGWVGDFRGTGYVHVRSGQNGALLAELQGSSTGDQFGWALANVGDVDGDGTADLLVGAPAAISLHQEQTSGRPGRVYLYSGADRTLVRAFSGLLPDDQFGAALAPLGDLDGDGLSEVLIGAPENGPGQTRPGYAVVVTGRFLRGASPEGR